VDAHQVLGVPATAGRVEIRRAYERLTDHLAAADAPTDELVRIVATAYRQLTRPGWALPGSIDPYRVLGVAPTATADDIRAAYRRLATVVHPDAGGTDELFRIVATAQDTAVEPSARWRPANWPKPRADRPFVAPDESELREVATWRAWATVAVDVAVLAAAAVVVYALATLARPQNMRAATIAVAVPSLVAFVACRPVVRGLLPALTRALRSYNAPIGAEPRTFLEERCFDSPVNRVADDRLYNEYLRWCLRRGRAGVAEWVFVEHLRRVGLLHIQSSSWTNGLWIGVRLREDAMA
jgi:hypothetical protein